LLRCRGRGQRLVIVLDNAKYHHARSLAPLLRRYRKVLTLLFLPPYSPQFNTIERLWKLARRLATHNRYFANLAALVDAVTRQFDRWRLPNDILWRLCCIT
jgi:transposase